ncbi:MAG: leucine-rich repeat domain-containing protein, partial [Eubacterium sp.]|nr:leucine-rich repeat domain-containing protein [Eubacterium sp.]
GKITKQATTTEEGEITYTCKDCHKTKIEKITKNHIHNFQIVSRIAPTCTEDGTTTIQCRECGTTITKKGDIELYSEWTTEKPKVSNGTTVQTKTQYSFSKREMDWKVVETGTIDYGSDWKGFDTGNSLYRQYNKTPVAAYENATTKVTVNTSHLGYIYWHWCSGNVYDKPYNRYVKSNRQNGYTTFHAYYSTEDIPFNAKANGYEKSKADICRDTYWWLQERIDVKRCSYTKYEKAQVGDFKTWSQWSDTPVKEDGNTKVKTRILYRTRTFIAGKATGHKIVIDPKVPATETKTGLTEGCHCSVCNKVIKPQKVIPAKWKEISSEKIKNTELKKNVVVADKKKGGKYRITKVTKKGKKVTGGTVEYVAPYDKNCKLVSATGKVKLGGATFKVTSIRKDAFSGCTKLKKVVIGSYVKDIGANAFYGCKSLKSVTIKSSSIKKIGTNAFKGINSKAKIIVPKKKLSAYRKLIKKAKVPGTVKVITK